jgi:hypothetical protein
MEPENSSQGQMDAQHIKSPHGLLGKATSPPGWRSSRTESIPVIGRVVWMLYMMFSYTTRYEAVADFLAEDLERQESEWIGKAVGVKHLKEEKKSVCV